MSTWRRLLYKRTQKKVWIEAGDNTGTNNQLDWEAIGCPKSREKVNHVLVRDGWGWVFLLILGSNLSGKGPCTRVFQKIIFVIHKTIG